MKRNIKYIFFLVFINSAFLIMIILCFMNYRIKHTNSKAVRNIETIYTYYDRSLSVGDFEQFDYDTTYEEMVECLGEPNGWVGSGIMRPYYELDDGRFAICHCFVKGNMESISIVNRKHFEYALLQIKLHTKTQEQKEIELLNVQQTEINAILWILGIKDWNRHLYQQSEWDEPMGKYSPEALKLYTDRDVVVDISYFFGEYKGIYDLPLFQIIQIYEDQEQIYFGFILWKMDWDDEEYSSDEQKEWILVDKGYFLEGQREILNFNSGDTDLTDINLAQEKFVNSITAFLRNQKEIFKGRDAWIEFWGVDENGKYMCVFITSPKKREEGIDADSEGVMYHYVTMETTDNKVDSVRVKLLDRKK